MKDEWEREVLCLVLMRNWAAFNALDFYVFFPRGCESDARFPRYSAGEGEEENTALIWVVFFFFHGWECEIVWELPLEGAFECAIGIVEGIPG